MSLTDDFKGALSRWASGVSVVTVNDGGLLYGLTVSSFSSVSLDPPLVLVCVNNSNRASTMIERSGRFAISVLAADQRDASNYFASPKREPTTAFTEIPGEWTVLRQPIIEGALAHLVCELHQLVPAGTHTIVLGQVVHAHHDETKQPLLYWNRAYREIDYK